MIKNILKMQPGRKTLAHLLFTLIGLMWILMFTFNVRAEDVTYSTVGGTWKKVNDTTWTMDKDGDGKTDVTLVKDGDEWRYIFSVADDTAMYYGWEADVPDGYEVQMDGYGTRENPAISLQYAHTSNIDNEGTQNGSYEGGVDTTKVYSVPGAKNTLVFLTCDLAEGDFLVIWSGNQPEYTAVKDYQKGTKIEGSRNESDWPILTIGDTVTIGFHSEKNGEKGYGYYAKIRGDSNSQGLNVTNISTEETPLDTGNIEFTKKVEDKQGNDLDTDEVFKFNIEFTTDDEEVKEALKGTKAYGDVTLTDGKGSFYISKDQTININGVPSKKDENGNALVKFKILEKSNNVEYKCEYSGQIDSETGENDFYPNNKYSVFATNIKDSEPVSRVQNLTVKKQVQNSNKNDSFRFYASFENLGKNAEYKYKQNEEEKTFTSDKNGEADVTFNLSDKGRAIFENLPEGCAYKITEEASDYYAAYELSDTVNVVQQKQSNAETNQSLSTGKETVDADENATVTFTNSGKEETKLETEITKISVKKIWNDNDNSAGRRPDSITVYLMQDENVIKNIKLNADNDWQAEIDNLDVYQEDGKTKYAYSVKEEEISGYTAEITSEDIDGGTSFIITNTSESVGSVKITKTVEGNGADKSKSFKFNIELRKDGKPVTGIYNLDDKAGSKTGTIAFDENGKSSFELKHGESIVLTGLPAGTEYTIAESTYKEYVPSDNGRYSGKIEENKIAEVSIVNTYKAKYNLAVSKTVKGNQGDKTKEFDFVLKLTGTDEVAVPNSVEYKKGSKSGSSNVVDGCINFKLAHGEAIVFKNLPDGISYEVIEKGAEDDGYTVKSENNLGNLSSNTEVEFTNTKNVGIPTSAMTNTWVMLGVVVVGGTGIIAQAKKKNKKTKSQ